MEDFRERGFGGGDWGIIPVGMASRSAGEIAGRDSGRDSGGSRRVRGGLGIKRASY